MKKLTCQLLLSVFLISASSNLSGQKITLEDIWTKGTFRQASLYGVNSMNDGLHYTTLEQKEGKQEINQYEYTSGKKKNTLLSAAALSTNSEQSVFKIDGYSFSKDEKKLLITSNTQRIYRYSSSEQTFVFNISTKKQTPIANGEQVQYATFSPDGSKVGYVFGNNVYYQDLNAGNITQVSFDGEKNAIINGASDWVYEEELTLVKAFEWSPDGSKLAYYRFDETKVKQFSMDVYSGLYPTADRFKYPKAGEENSSIQIHVYQLDNQSDQAIYSQDEGYVPRIKWSNDPNQLLIVSMNRLQNEVKLLMADVRSGDINTFYTDHQPTYIEINHDIEFLPDNSLIWASETSGYNQLYQLIPATGDALPLTDGEFEVTDYVGFDNKRQRLYYMRADEGDAINRYLYAFSMTDKTSKKLTQEVGFHRVNFSKGMRYYIDYHSTANSPQRISVNDPLSGKEVRVIEENNALQNKLNDFKFADLTFFTFDNKKGASLNAWMIKPTDFDPNKKYPVLMYVYGGPGSQTVTNSWGGSNFAWFQLLAQKGYIVVSVDNRGTGARGNEFKTSTYKQLGKYETEDQIEGAKYLASLPYVDAKRIGIWGWSYGGYMTTLCMTKGADYFKTGIAVAPVTNWRYYDSIYTERFMQTPQENAEGYDTNSPINHVDKLKGNYLLVHGTADDNVHFQNTTELIKALIEAGKQFDLAIYPDKNHSIGGGKTRLHLYQKMTDYIVENL
jgi:dipeptidyl-peptidase-4